MKIKIVTGLKDYNIMEYIADFRHKGNEFLFFPESRKHPKDVWTIVEETINKCRISNKTLYICTFSEVIINCIGMSIYHKYIKNQDVEVIIIKNGFTEPKVTIYDNDGRIKGWEIGFFSPTV